MDNKKTIQVHICMGSSCFSRGNREALLAVQSYIRQKELETVVKLVGGLCEGKCTTGPNIRIDDVLYDRVDPSTVNDLIEFHLKKGDCEKKEDPA